mgnify:FL=1
MNCLRPNEQGPTNVMEGSILLSNFPRNDGQRINIKGTVENVAADLESDSHRGTRTPSPAPLS